MKEGDIIVYTYSGGYLTTGKQYTILSIVKNVFIDIINDRGDRFTYLTSEFMLLDDYRDSQLDKLLL